MRLDHALVARGLARSRTKARDLIVSGRVRVDGRAVTKPATDVAAGQRVEADREPYVSRAAYKLLGALDDSATPVPARVLDAGASTGGFTQVLLERGAATVYAVDVGHGQLAGEIAGDPRVVVRERLNLRDLTLADLDGEPVDLVVADVSFISLTLLVAPLLGVLRTDGVALLMVKPQFEVGRSRLGHGGIVHDETDHADAVDCVAAAARDLGWAEDWRGVSHLSGQDGNTEFFLRLRRMPQ